MVGIKRDLHQHVTPEDENTLTRFDFTGLAKPQFSTRHCVMGKVRKKKASEWAGEGIKNAACSKQAAS